MSTSNKNNCVSYVKPEVIQDDYSDFIDEEHAQLSLDPKLQTYLAQMSQESGCWGKLFPMPFERAAQKSWWDPTFDSEILEEQYKKSSNPHSRFKFRYTLWYMIFVSSVWLVYFFTIGLLDNDSRSWPLLSCLFVILFCVCVALLITYTRLFQNYMVTVSTVVAFILIVSSLAFLIVVQPLPVGHFSVCVQMLILIYTLIPLKLYVGLSMAIFYSVAFELLTGLLSLNGTRQNESPYSILTRLLCHLAIHCVGFHIYFMSNVRMRNTFMKVGQSLLVRRQLELEKRLKENMIHSLMPPSVANWLLHDDDNFTRRHSSESANDIRSLFRPFNMDTMENVSILFADIVGFTKMSSNKNAEELVDILNNLFQRFDLLCKYHNCEKISTLGDCYYCVSGCPEARPDHAVCCVEMGLSMIQAIKHFEQENHEGVNMRVGVHTGTVLCGIVGTRRFKFDVWSNDVTIANAMESTGKPGMVHISDTTRKFLNDMFLLEEGEIVFGLQTYFILGRKGDRTPSYQGSFRAEGRQKYANSLQLFVSPPTNSPSVSPQSRPRVLSCVSPNVNLTSHNSNLLSPETCIVKANSLPSILDSENEQQETVNSEFAPSDLCGVENVKTPTSTASSGKYSIRLKNWKLPKFMKKTLEGKQDGDEVDADSLNRNAAGDDGYQQVPTILESTRMMRKGSCTTLPKIYDDDGDLCKEPIDIKSYISHSRSDIGHFDYSPTPEFIRGGSYRSQFGRSYNGEVSILNRAGSSRSRRGVSPNLDGQEPMGRLRSATITAANLPTRPKKSVEIIPSRLSSMARLDDYSAQGRKDSGIKSNSRRSSIQQIDTALLNSEILQHRVSGYYTSSQSSVNTLALPNRMAGPFFDKYGTCIQNLRKQSDRQLIKCVQDNSKSECSYFIKPPLSSVSLFFRDKTMEQDYRANVHHIQKSSKMETLATSRFNTYLDVFISLLVFAIVSTGLALICGVTTFWLVTFFVFLLFQFLNFALCFITVVRWTDRICWCTSRFYRWNIFGGVLVSLPLISSIVNFIPVRDTLYIHLHIYTYILFVGLIHFCNFTQLNCWMKNVVATIVCVGFIVFFMTDQSEYFDVVLKDKMPGGVSSNNISNSLFTSDDLENLLNNITNLSNTQLLVNRNVTTVSHSSTSSRLDDYYLKKNELLLNLLLLLVLVWLLNREFEIGYRIGFHTNYIANRDKSHVQSLKNQADYLIYNIVPEHVADQLKKDAKYSENFKDVGIIFASIVNFNEMYDETYAGGREYLRVLNELIADFDELLDRPEFRCVEKIKTIGSTFMAASGLNSQMRNQQRDPNEHLYALMDFALEMQNVVNNFNRDLIEFNLIIRIGYNFGDVTAAVIGNTKLYYDIWGDAVNIASRMDSTGVNGRIQVGEGCLPVLEKKYEFEARGSVYVKGKDHMNVYLLKRKKSPDFLDVPAVVM